MIYDTLSEFYDALVKDEESSKRWADYVQKNLKEGSILELACGSGEISNLLYKRGYDILATDISKKMLERLNYKFPYIKTALLDMTWFVLEEKYDGIICFCDSINYILDLETIKTIFNQVYTTLNKGGVFLFDMHTKERLDEFKVPFIEEGNLLGTDYQWSIISNEDRIYHNFNFYLKDRLENEQHIQRVYDLDIILNLLKEVGFKNIGVSVDFDLPQDAIGEKYFIRGIRE